MVAPVPIVSSNDAAHRLQLAKAANQLASQAITTNANVATNTTGIATNVTAIAATNATVAALTFLNNARLAKTAAYALANADKGKTIALGGAALYALTLAAVAGYDANFLALIINEDVYVSQGSGTQGRAKIITISNSPQSYSFMLWPGQAIIAFIDNGKWQFMPGGNSSQNAGYRWKIDGQITIFVDSALGSDSNDGMTTGAGGAFKHIASAVAALYQQFDLNNFGGNIIKLADGTYTEAVTVANSPVGCNVFFITGNTTTPANVAWAAPGNNTACLLLGDAAEVEISGFTFTAGAFTGCTALAMHQTAICDVLTGIVFGVFTGGTHISTDHGGCSVNLPASYTINGGAAVHIHAGPGCFIGQAGGGTVTLTGTPAFTIIYQYNGPGACISLGLVTFAGTATGTKFAGNWLGGFSAGGSTLPGSIAGANTNGAVNI
jgi:hypothetical protein